MAATDRPPHGTPERAPVPAVLVGADHRRGRRFADPGRYRLCGPARRRVGDRHRIFFPAASALVDAFSGVICWLAPLAHETVSPECSCILEEGELLGARWLSEGRGLSDG